MKRLTRKTPNAEMPQNKRPAGGRKANVRLSAIDNDRLQQLIELHGDSESNVLRDALTLKWYVDIGFGNLRDVQLLQRETDVLTNYGQNDPDE